MPLSYRDPEHRRELMRALMHDTNPKGMDVCYVFSQTADNQPDTLDVAISGLGQAWKKILVCGEEPRGTNYCGIAFVRDYLRKGNVRDEDIAEIRVPKGVLHTLSEAEALVEYCQRQQIETVAIIWPLFHIRVIPSVLTAHSRLRKRRAVAYHSVYVAQPIDVVVTHSRELGRSMTRRELLANEWEKAATYQAQGNLVGIEVVLDYFR